MSQSSCFGMAGHLAAMSEFLLRGYNVALPFVDRGDDILTIEDADSLIRRVQVKTSNTVLRGTTIRLKYKLKARQLHTPDRETQLFYMFMWRNVARWHWILVSRGQLNDIRVEAENRRNTLRNRCNELTLDIRLDTADAEPILWGQSLAPYHNHWTADWAPLGLIPDEPRGVDLPPQHP